MSESSDTADRAGARPLAELKQHLVSLPDHPGWILYRTSYYRQYRAFRASHRELEQLDDGEHAVRIAGVTWAAPLTGRYT